MLLQNPFRTRTLCCFSYLRLKEAEEARTICVSIEGLECSGEMVKALQGHAECMTNIYRDLNRMTIAAIDDEASYADIFKKSAEYMSWYAKRKRVANSMKAAAQK